MDNVIGLTRYELSSILRNIEYLNRRIELLESKFPIVETRVIDARCSATVDNTYGADEAGVLDALRDAMITHGLIAAS